jgi:hypothetical protein
MNHFLSIDYWSYGQKVLYGVFSGRDWMENKIFFPRIVYCDFAIRYLGDNNLNYTVRKKILILLKLNNFYSFRFNVHYQLIFTMNVYLHFIGFG